MCLKETEKGVKMTSFLKEMLKEKVCWGEGVFPFWHQENCKLFRFLFT